MECSSSFDYQHGQTSVENVPMRVGSASVSQQEASGPFTGDLRNAITGLHADLYGSDMRIANVGSGYPTDFKDPIENDLRNSITRSQKDISDNSVAREESGPVKELVSRHFQRDLRNIISGSSVREIWDSVGGEDGRKSSVSKEVIPDIYSRDLRDTLRPNQRTVDFNEHSVRHIGYRDASSDTQHKREVKVSDISRESSTKNMCNEDYVFLTKTLKQHVDPSLGWSKGSSSNPYAGMDSSRVTTSEMSDYKKSYKHTETSIPHHAPYILENSTVMMNVNPTPVSIASSAIKPHPMAGMSSNPQLLQTGGLGVTNLYGGSDLMLLNPLTSRNQGVVSLAPVVMSAPVQIMETATVNKSAAVTIGGSFWDTIKKEGLLSYEKNPVKIQMDSNELDTTQTVGEDFQIPSFSKKRTSDGKRSRSRSPQRKSHSSAKRDLVESRISPSRERRYRQSISPGRRSKDRSSRHTKEKSPRKDRARSRSPLPEKGSNYGRVRVRERSRHSRESSPVYRERSRHSKESSPVYRERSPRVKREISPRQVRRFREVSPHTSREEPPRSKRERLQVIRKMSPHMSRERSRLSRDISTRMVRERSPRVSREISPRMSREISPRMLREISPRMLREISPRMSREISPRMLREISPRMSREISHRMLREISPRMSREISPRMLREISPRMSREISPLMSREISPQMSREISLHLRPRREMSPVQRRDIPRKFAHEGSPRIERHYSKERSSVDRKRERDLRSRERSPLRYNSSGNLGYVGGRSGSPQNVRYSRELTPEHIRYLPERSRHYSPPPVRVLPPENYTEEEYRRRFPVPVRVLSPEYVRRHPDNYRSPSPHHYGEPYPERRYPRASQTPPARVPEAADSREKSPFKKTYNSPPQFTSNSPQVTSQSPQVPRRGSEEDRESPRRSWDTRNVSKRQKGRRRRRNRLREDRRALAIVTRSDSGSLKESNHTSSFEGSEDNLEKDQASPLDLREEASDISDASNDDETFGKKEAKGNSPLFDIVSISSKSDGYDSPGTPISDEKPKTTVDDDLQECCSPVSLADLPVDVEEDTEDKENVGLPRDLSPVSLDEHSLDSVIGEDRSRSKSPISDTSRGSLVVTDSVDVGDSPQPKGDKENEDLRVQLLRIREEKVELKLKKLEEESLETEMRLQNLSPDILVYSPQRDTPSPLLDECEDERSSESANRKFYGY